MSFYGKDLEAVFYSLDLLYEYTNQEEEDVIRISLLVHIMSVSVLALSK